MAIFNSYVSHYQRVFLNTWDAMWRDHYLEGWQLRCTLGVICLGRFYQPLQLVMWKFPKSRGEPQIILVIFC